MARALYRLYLYFVCVVLLGIVAFSVGNLLGTVLQLTPLRGQYNSAPPASSVVQAVVAAIVALIVSGVLGGVHYWLIRRDMKSEGAAALGAVRAAALNLVLVIAALVALFAGTTALQSIGNPYSGGIVGSVASALTALALYVLVEWERRRAVPGATAGARTLERLHAYGVPMVALIAGIFTAQSAVRWLLIAVLLSTGVWTPPDPCQWSFTGPPSCALAGPLVGQWLAVLWIGCFLVYYGLRSRGDTHSILRLVAHYLGLLIGLVTAIIGLQQLVEVVLRALLQVAPLTADTIVTRYTFVPPLLTGAVVCAVYVRWLLSEGAQTRLGAIGTRLTVLTLASIALGVPFYVGVYQLLLALVEPLVHGGSALSTSALATAIGWLVAGAVHPLLAGALRRQSTAEAPIGPRRSLIFAGLAAGALMAAIGIAIALYLVITASIGTAAAGDWAAQARQAGEMALVGLYLAGIHGWRLYGDRKLVLRPISPAPAAGVSPAAGATDAVQAHIGTIVDDVLAGRITRDEAITRLMGTRGPTGG